MIDLVANMKREECFPFPVFLTNKINDVKIEMSFSIVLAVLVCTYTHY